jgi:phage terminase large subunit
VDELGECYLYREYAESDKIISQGSKEILECSTGEDISITFAPPDLWGRSQESARSRADLFHEAGLPLFKAGNNREAGWLAIKELLKVYDAEEGKTSRLHIFDTCPQIIEHLTALQRDPHRPNDCLTEPHEITHLPDALRYFATGYIGKAKKPEVVDEYTEFKRKKIRSMRMR